MSNADELFKRLCNIQGLDESEILNLFSRLMSKKIYESIQEDLYERKDNININERLFSIEDDVIKLKKDFEIYLKSEFKEESNNVFIEIVKKNNLIKYLYLKPTMEKNIYCIVYKGDSYIDFLDNIIEEELKVEDSYPMLKFDFHHFNENELDNVNLTGYYLLYSNEV